MDLEIDEFISFIMSHKDDERVSIEKDIKYGHKNYWIIFDIDSESNQNNQNNSWGMINGRLSIHFDKRNKAIFFSSDSVDISTISIEDEELLEKWCSIIESYIESNLKDNFRRMIDESLSSCYNKNIHREWKMKKIFDKDEPL